jgi:hypothetical protein
MTLELQRDGSSFSDASEYKSHPVQEAALPGWLSLPAMRYPGEYLWFVFVSSLDIMLTWTILELGGREVNPIARVVIQSWGLPGAIGFKFGLMILVVIACEVVGRQRDRTGRALARAAVAVSALPVIYSLVLISVHVVNWQAMMSQ